jgi:PAS domain-containing protein
LYVQHEHGHDLILKYQENAPELPANVHPGKAGKAGNPAGENSVATVLAGTIGRAFGGEITRFAAEGLPCCLNVPIACRGKILGVMSFIEVPDAAIAPDQQELLLSIGRQIGIAIESLSDRQRLVQSKELLQSVFDGITDMVVLLDRDFKIKMVNRAYLTYISHDQIRFQKLTGKGSKTDLTC